MKQTSVTQADLRAIEIAYDELVSYYETVGAEGDLDDEGMPSGKIPWACDRLDSLLDRAASAGYGRATSHPQKMRHA